MKTAKERNKERLVHISDAIAKIERYTKGLKEEDFYNDSKTNEAVLFQLSIIGEAIIHVDNSLLEKYNYPWHEVRALRNVITHEYFGINMDKVWSTIQDDLSDLKSVILQVLKKEF